MAHDHSHHHGEEHVCECGGDCGEQGMHHNEQMAIVESAKPLSEKDRVHMTELVTKIAGQPVAVEFTVNAGLLGGFTVQLGDRKLDASIRAQLSQMKSALKGNSNG